MEKKRKANETNQQRAHMAAKKQRHTEHQATSFLKRMKNKFAEKNTVRDLHKAQKTCLQLDQRQVKLKKISFSLLFLFLFQFLFIRLRLVVLMRTDSPMVSMLAHQSKRSRDVFGYHLISQYKKFLLSAISMVSPSVCELYYIVYFPTLLYFLKMDRKL